MFDLIAGPYPAFCNVMGIDKQLSILNNTLYELFRIIIFFLTFDPIEQLSIPTVFQNI